MAKRGGAATDTPGVGARGAKILMRAVGGLILATVFVLTAMKLEAFLIRDPRFLLPTPPVPGMHTSTFRVSGTFYTSGAQVQRVFARDFGRSVYLCPIAQRRVQLLGIDWVQDATVARVWPNRIDVRIRERIPVAFVEVSAADGTTLPRLIDAEGVILDPQRPVKLRLPVLTGARSGDSPEVMKRRVERLLAFQANVGTLMDRISEVDIADLENVRVIMPVKGRVLTLLTGNRDYRERLDNLLTNYSEITKRIPNATVLDLRVPGRITAASEQPSGTAVSGGNHGR